MPVLVPAVSPNGHFNTASQDEFFNWLFMMKMLYWAKSAPQDGYLETQLFL